MNAAQALNFETGRYLSDAWKCADAPLTVPPPCPVARFVYYTPAQARILAVLMGSPRPMTVIELGAALKMSRFTVYDCVMNVAAIVHTGMHAREKCYWVTK